MTTQKIFKQRVRARMAKTGEAYTAARRQLLDKADPPEQDASAKAPASGAPSAPAPAALSTTDEAIRRATGRPHAEWFALLDGWDATTMTHTEIARRLHEKEGVGAWWSQSITVDYERARGMRAQHEMRTGFSISVTRTIAREADDLLRSFTDPGRRAAWLPDAPMTARPTRAKRTARFDWSDPDSRLVVSIDSKGTDRAAVTVSHERLPDAESAEKFKRTWRGWLDALKAHVEPE